MNLCIIAKRHILSKYVSVNLKLYEKMFLKTLIVFTRILGCQNVLLSFWFKTI